MNYFMGIDLGTSSVKSIIMSETGEILGITQKSYDISKPKSDYAQQDMNLLWGAAKATIHELLKEYPGIENRIQGISYSGQQHGLVMVDKNGALLHDAIIWADQRSRQEIEKIYAIVPEEEYKSVVLNSVSSGFLISSLMWIKDHKPEVYEKIDKVLLPKDYIRYKMSGEFGTDMSDASSTAVFDTGKRQWAWDLIERLEIEKDFFVSCHESYEIAGEVTKQCAEETGLKQHSMITYGGGDSLMQAIGNGMISTGILSVNIGTASQIACSLNQPLCDSKFRTNTFCHVLESMWMIMGASLSGGVALKWLMNNILLMESFDEMTSLAAKIQAGSEGLLFLPYLNGERTPYLDPNAKGIYLGLTLKHSRAHMIRSTMEGIIFGLKSSIGIFEELGIEFNRIIASGGGARGRLFREIQADVFGKEIYTNSNEEQACLGAAITAAVGVKAYTSYEEACEKIVNLSADIVEPNLGNRNRYEERFQVYREIYHQNKDLF